MIEDSEAHKALRDSLVQIKGTPYSTDLADENVKDTYDAEWLNDTSDGLYPKVAVLLNGGRDYKLPNYGYRRVLDFSVFFICKKLPSSDRTTQVQTGDWVKDLRKRLVLDAELGGKVHEARMMSYMTDGGVLEEEGMVAAVLEVELFD